jgi:hypothetical protein
MKTTTKLVALALAAATALPVIPAAPAVAMPLSRPATISADLPSSVEFVSRRGRRNTAIGVGVALGVLGAAAAASAARRERDYYYYGGQPYYGPGPVYVEPQPRYYRPAPVYVEPEPRYYYERAPRVAVPPRGQLVDNRGRSKPGHCWIVTNQDTQAGYWRRCY